MACLAVCAVTASWPLVLEVEAGAVERAQAVRPTAEPPCQPHHVALPHLEASQLPPFSRRAVTTRSRCLAQSRCAGPAPDRALPCGECGRSVWAWRRGLGLWAGTPGTTPWATRGARPSAGAEREPRRVWARGLATVCFLVRRFIRGRGAFSTAGFVQMHAVARRSRCPALAAIGGRARWRSRRESCVTRWFLSLAPEKTPLFTWLHFPLVKRFSLDPGVKRLR